MNRLVVFVPFVLLLLPTRADARQTISLEAVRGQHVFVFDSDRREWQGKLLIVAKDALTLELDSAPRVFPLSDVIRVDAEGDSVRDGTIKGAIFGALLGLLSTNDARGVVAGAAVYGVIGLGIDALNSNKATVYRAPATALVKVSW